MCQSAKRAVGIVLTVAVIAQPLVAFAGGPGPSGGSGTSGGGPGPSGGGGISGSSGGSPGGPSATFDSRQRSGGGSGGSGSSGGPGSSGSSGTSGRFEGSAATSLSLDSTVRAPVGPGDRGGESRVLINFNDRF